MTRADERATATAKVLLVVGGCVLAGLAVDVGTPLMMGIAVVGAVLACVGILL